jgi:hypothetical protein
MRTFELRFKSGADAMKFTMTIRGQIAVLDGRLYRHHETESIFESGKDAVVRIVLLPLETKPDKILNLDSLFPGLSAREISN